MYVQRMDDDDDGGGGGGDEGSMGYAFHLNHVPKGYSRRSPNQGKHKQQTNKINAGESERDGSSFKRFYF